jgi:hypothetical protein
LIDRPPRGTRLTYVAARPVAAAAIVVTSLALAADPVTSSKDETQRTLSGKSITYDARGGTSGALVIFFSPEGQMTMKLTNSARASSGTWSLDERGRHCLKVLSGTGSDGCRHLLKTGTG